MKLHPTPEMLERAYDYLRATMPFRKWKLPDPDEVEFHVTRTLTERGHERKYRTHFEIGVSAACMSTTDALMRVMAHEMVHVRCDMLGERGNGHGGSYPKLAAQVCAYHGFDVKLFY